MSAVAEPARAPQRLRRALLAVASLLALLLVGMGAYSLLDLAARQTTTERASYPDVGSLVIEDASEVRLTGAPADASLQVLTRVTEGLRSPDRDAERTAGGGLVLSSSCPALFGGSCRVEYEIRVPAGTEVRADASDGEVTAQDLTSTEPLELSTSAGDVTAIDVTSPSIALSSSAGDVQARGLSAARVELDTSAGDVVAALRTPAQRLLAASSAGDVELLLPDAVYRVDASSSAGDVDASSVRTDPVAPRTVTAHSSAGDVRIAARR